MSTSRSTPPTLHSHSSCSSPLESFDRPRIPLLAAYRIRPHQVPQIHKRLQTIIPELGYKENDASQYIQKSLQRDTQVVFVAQDDGSTPLPHECIMLSMGKGSRARIYHTSRTVESSEQGYEGVNWFQWVEATAEGSGLQRIELPYTIFLEDIGWMLRALSGRARGLQEHAGDTHLIHRVERFFLNVVLVVRKQVWAESNLMSWKRSATY